MLPTIHRRTQVDHSYGYPAVLVSVPSDNYIYHLTGLFVRYLLIAHGIDCVSGLPYNGLMSVFSKGLLGCRLFLKIGCWGVNIPQNRLLGCHYFSKSIVGVSIFLKNRLYGVYFGVLALASREGAQ